MATANGPRPAHTPIELDVGGETWTMQSELASVQVRVHEPDGSLVGESVVRVPRTALDHGFFAACEHVRATGEGIRSDQPVEPVYLRAVSSLLALFAIVSSDAVLGDVFWSVVRPPSTWSVVTNLGVSVSLSPYFSRCAPVLEQPAHLPRSADAYAVPIVIEVNDESALHAELLVTAPDPPLHLCGGITAIRATHPTDAELEMSMVLLAARCGPRVEARAGPAFSEAR